MDSCEICGAIDDIMEYDELNRRMVYVCSRGKCCQEMDREMRAMADEEYERDLEDLNARHGRL